MSIIGHIKINSVPIFSIMTHQFLEFKDVMKVASLNKLCRKTFLKHNENLFIKVCSIRMNEMNIRI